MITPLRPDHLEVMPVPARRCSMCGRNYSTNVFRCADCGNSTNYMSDETPDDVAIGRGEEYVLRIADYRVVTDPKILSWRSKELERAGYTKHQIDVLAPNGDVDLHRAVDLAGKAGPETAFDILS